MFFFSPEKPDEMFDLLAIHKIRCFDMLLRTFKVVCYFETLEKNTRG